jgi:hypothetical protein
VFDALPLMVFGFSAVLPIASFRFYVCTFVSDSLVQGKKMMIDY